MALVPALLGRAKPVVRRTAERHRWPLEVVPGYAKRQRIALVDLERVTGFVFTAADVATAERRHGRKAEEARAKRNVSPPTSAAYDLGLIPSPTEDTPFKGVPDDPARHD
jgi:hypothetical protein